MSFKDAVKIILEHEGGDVNDPNDPGGETDMEISRRHHPEAWKKGRPTKAMAEAIYKKDYYDNKRLNCSSLDSGVALCIFDCSVNQGVRTAALILQDALGVKQDTWIGKQTAAAANKNTKRTIERFTAKRFIKYSNRGKLWAIYAEGWMVRVLKTQEIANDLVKTKKKKVTKKEVKNEIRKPNKKNASKPKPRKKGKT